MWCLKIGFHHCYFSDANKLWDYVDQFNPESGEIFFGGVLVARI